MSKKQDSARRMIAHNKRARFDYFIEEKLEAGLVLYGSEVKSMREGRGVSINECYAGEQNGELFLFNAHIPEYKNSNPRFQHAPRRPRKLLLHKREMNKILGALQKQGMTLVPIALYFAKNGFVKAEIGLAKGKKKHDKRETIKERDWDRQKSRILREKNSTS
jgi:SsrA-binding protein